MDRCHAPGCEEAATQLIQGSTDDGAEMWEVDAFTDAAGGAFVTSARAKLSASGWPACDDHDRLDVADLPAWWRSAPETTRQAVRDCDYLAERLPPSIVADMARMPGMVAWSHWEGEPPETYVRGSDVLRALDAAERPADT